MKYLFIFMFGASGYGILEILWRGYTHWTMLLTGGICFLVLYLISHKFKSNTTIEKAILGSLIITVTELFVGILVNLILGWKVWDYSALSFNILGQVCLWYSTLWFFVSYLILKNIGKFEKFIIFLQKNKT